MLTADARERHRVVGCGWTGVASRASRRRTPPAGLRCARPPRGRRRRPGVGGRPRARAGAPAPAAAMALVQDVDGLADLDGRGEIFVDPPDYSIINPVAARSREPEPGRAARACPALSRAARRLLHRAAQAAAPPGAAPRGAARGRPAHGDGPAGLSRGRAPRGGVALVGDAAGFYDPFTGEGLYTALRGAELLAEVAHDALRRGESRARRWRRTRGRAARRSATRRGSRARCRR